jgi:prepilin-type N-terminal cleavage/methylation domain-containing protein
VTVRRRAGFTLVELMIALVLSAVVLGAMYRVLNSNQRFYRAQGEVTEVQQNLRAASLILPAEFRELAASEGDIIAMSATSITIRAMRSFMVVCATPVVATGTVIVRNSLTFGFRSVDLTRDSLLIFRDGNPQMSSDDRWLTMGPSATASGVCADGGAGTTFVVNGSGTSARSFLDSVTVGAPVRAFERVRYSAYNDGTGTYWLGVESFVGGAWGAISPVAGPLRGSDGIGFTYYDATGTVTATAANVASIQVTARGQSARQINVPGRPTGYYRDSVVVRAALRNN